MKLKGIVAEDFVNYKKPSLFLITSCCNWKCCHDGGFAESVCQNNSLVSQPTRDIDDDGIVSFYMNNPITKAIVFGGLEPIDQYDEMVILIGKLRQRTSDDIVIYTGYKEEEVLRKVEGLTYYDNIIVKFGRYVPYQKQHYDELLGVYLASNNQYAKKIS